MSSKPAYSKRYRQTNQLEHPAFINWVVGKEKGKRKKEKGKRKEKKKLPGLGTDFTDQGSPTIKESSALAIELW
jgi:hypothetical protein